MDIVSGEPLFSSLDKFDAHCGWPSFTQPLEAERIKNKVDFKLLDAPHGGALQGRGFPLGPRFQGWAKADRVALLHQLGGVAFFVPVDQLEAEGYGEYLAQFQTKG